MKDFEFHLIPSSKPILLEPKSCLVLWEIGVKRTMVSCTLLEFILRDSTVLDLCCGTGTIALAVSKGVRKVLGIELVQEAVTDARRNAELNGSLEFISSSLTLPGVTNTEFFAGRVEDVLKTVLQSCDLGGDMVAILDPPRAGVHSSIIKAIRRQQQIKQILYISCDPAGLLRNADGYANSRLYCSPSFQVMLHSSGWTTIPSSQGNMGRLIPSHKEHWNPHVISKRIAASTFACSPSCFSDALSRYIMRLAHFSIIPHEELIWKPVYPCPAPDTLFLLPAPNHSRWWVPESLVSCGQCMSANMLLYSHCSIHEKQFWPILEQVVLHPAQQVPQRHVFVVRQVYCVVFLVVEEQL